MEEINFKDFKDFGEALGIPHASSDLQVFILDTSKINQVLLERLNFYRNEFYEVSIAEHQLALEFAIDGKFYPQKKEPCISFVAPDQLQSFKLYPEHFGTNGFILFFPRALYQNLRKVQGQIPFYKRDIESYYQLTRDEFDELMDWCQLMMKEYQNPNDWSNGIMTHLLGVLFLKCQKLLQQTKSAFVSRPEEIMDHFVHLLETDVQHCSVAHYADQMALTPRQLNTLTKRVFGKTALGVIQEATVEKAKALLLQSALSTTEIAYQLGFDELSNFSRLFKRVSGHSPNQFKEIGRK